MNEVALKSLARRQVTAWVVLRPDVVRYDHSSAVTPIASKPAGRIFANTVGVVVAIVRRSREDDDKVVLGERTWSESVDRHGGRDGLERGLGRGRNHHWRLITVGGDLDPRGRAYRLWLSYHRGGGSYARCDFDWSARLDADADLV